MAYRRLKNHNMKHLITLSINVLKVSFTSAVLLKCKQKGVSLSAIFYKTIKFDREGRNFCVILLIIIILQSSLYQSGGRLVVNRLSE